VTWRFSEELDWMKRAACAGMDGDAFFGGTRGVRPSVGLLPCATCPVQPACYEFAVTLGPDTYGIWGGRRVR
jgi:hypothetical protein